MYDMNIIMAMNTTANLFTFTISLNKSEWIKLYDTKEIYDDTKRRVNTQFTVTYNQETDKVYLVGDNVHIFAISKDDDDDRGHSRIRLKDIIPCYLFELIVRYLRLNCNVDVSFDLIKFIHLWY